MNQQKQEVFWRTGIRPQDSLWGHQFWFFKGCRLRFDTFCSCWRIQVSSVSLKPLSSFLLQPRDSPRQTFSMYVLPSRICFCLALHPAFSLLTQPRVHLASDGAPGSDLGIRWDEASSTCSHGSQSLQLGQEHQCGLVLEPSQAGTPEPSGPVVLGGKTKAHQG